jgi:hypothetical protein
MGEGAKAVIMQRQQEGVILTQDRHEADRGDDLVQLPRSNFIELLLQFRSPAASDAPRVAVEVLSRRVRHAHESTL